MKKLLCGTLCIALATGTPVVLVSMADTASARPHSIRHSIKHSVKTAGSRKPQTAPHPPLSAAANPDAIDVPPGLETLTFAEGQQAAAAAKAGQQALAHGNLGKAEAEFRFSTRLNASDPYALAGLAQTLEQEGKSRESISVYRYLLYPKQGWQTSMEKDEILRMHFALLLAGDEQWAEAVSVYENTVGGVSYGSSFPALNVHFSPSTSHPALFRAMAHLVMGITYDGHADSSQALAEYAAAVRAEPGLALAQYYYGQGLLTLGRRAEAKVAFEKANDLDDQGEVRQAAEEALKGQ